MSTTQSVSGQRARWKFSRNAGTVIIQIPARFLINFLEWISSNEAANRGLGTITSIISVFAVVVAVYQYYASASERELQSRLAIWADLTNNTGQKDAIELLVMHHVPMSSIHLTKADLSTVAIAGANLSYSDIEDTNLSNTDLTGVEFAGATIRNDDFSYANLSAANLNNLNLNNATHDNNFSGAVLPDNVNLTALATIACVARDSRAQVIWPVMGGKKLTTWPLDNQGHPKMCEPAKPWQASCASTWCNPTPRQSRGTTSVRL